MNNTAFYVVVGVIVVFHSPAVTMWIDRRHKQILARQQAEAKRDD